MSISTKDEYIQFLLSIRDGIYPYEELVLKYSNLDHFRDIIKDAMLTYNTISIGTEEEYIFINIYIILYVLGISTLSITDHIENPQYDPSKTLSEQVRSLVLMFLELV